MTILLALDSFKGCLSSYEACQAAACGVLDANPNATIKVLPLSDGGEGLTEVLTQANNGRFNSIKVHGPLMEPINATYGIIPATKMQSTDTAIIEMAAACGLPLVPLEKRNPEHTTTYGFGEMILDALQHGCKRLILGIGGSATNDAGIGMLQALGASIQLIKSSKSHFLTGADLSNIKEIDTSCFHELFQDVSILVACDVQNPLHGPQGAAYIFAPQKGADAATVKRLDAGLKHILTLSKSQTQSGDGAAGGLGFALRHFLHAQMQPGIELVFNQLHFDSLLTDTDIIITGEGKSDAQTLMGKVPMGVLRHAQRQKKKVYLIAGKVEEAPLLLYNGFAGVHCINDGDDSTLQELMRPEHAFTNIRHTVANIVCQTYHR